VVPAAGHEELPNGLEGPHLAGLGTEMGELVAIDRQTHQVEEIREADIGVEARLLEAIAHFREECFRMIIRGDPAILPQQVQDRHIRRGTTVRYAVAPHIPDSLAAGTLAKLIKEL